MSDKWVARGPLLPNCAFSRCKKGAILNVMDKISVALRLRICYVGCNNASLKDTCTLQTDVTIWKRPLDRIERGWLNESNFERISLAQHLNQSNAANRRCWQEWVNNADIRFRTAAVVPGPEYNWKIAADSSLSKIYHVACIHLYNMTLGRHLREWKLCFYRPLTLTSHACTPSNPIRVLSWR